MLQEHDGALNFMTDGWTSPNHKVFVTVTIHFENDGVPICMVLNIVELAMSHSGVNLASAFTHILQEFGISEKVSIYQSILERNLPMIFSFLASLVTMCPPTIQ
jgi:hypothetical protein